MNPAPYSVPPVSVRRTMHLHLLARSVASEKAAAIRPASIYFVATLSRAKGLTSTPWLVLLAPFDPVFAVILYTANFQTG